MRPRISIIIPCYNAEEYLQETLECLQQQSINDWECIIVNDGSKDGSSTIAHKYSERDKRYKVIDKENEGPSIARNTGIKASCGKYILPLDADDLIAKTYAEDAIDYLEKHPSCKLVYGKAEFIGDKTGEWKLEDYEYDKELWANLIYCSAVYRRSDYDKTIGYNPNMRHGLEDWDFWLSLLNSNDDVFQLPYVVFFYRQHGVSRTTSLTQNIEGAYRQILLNHIDIYERHLPQLFKSKDVNQYLESELNGVLNSKSYLLGKTLWAPIRLLKSLFSR